MDLTIYDLKLGITVKREKMYSGISVEECIYRFIANGLHAHKVYFADHSFEGVNNAFGTWNNNVINYTDEDGCDWIYTFTHSTSVVEKFNHKERKARAREQAYYMQFICNIYDDQYIPMYYVPEMCKHHKDLVNDMYFFGFLQKAGNGKVTVNVNASGICFRKDGCGMHPEVRESNRCRY